MNAFHRGAEKAGDEGREQTRVLKAFPLLAAPQSILPTQSRSLASFYTSPKCNWLFIFSYRLLQRDII